MREYGYKPSTGTLDLLCDACGSANAEDAPDVYTALRAHDVPEFVAYSASMKVPYPSRATNTVSFSTSSSAITVLPFFSSNVSVLY